MKNVKLKTELMSGEPAVPDEHLLVVEGEGAEDGTSSTRSGGRRVVPPFESRVQGDGQRV